MRKKSFFSALVKKLSVAEEKGDTLSKDFLLEVSKYVKEGTYSTNKKAARLSRLFLGEDGLYSLDSFIAAELGISESTVRAHRRNLSMELYDLFGEDFFDLFDNVRENKNEILKRIYLVENLNLPLQDRFLSGVITPIRQSTLSIKKEDIVGIELSECSSEVDFLVRYSRGAFLGELKSLNPHKLKYLLSLMEDGGSYSDRFELLSAFTKKGGDS